MAKKGLFRSTKGQNITGSKRVKKGQKGPKIEFFSNICWFMAEIELVWFISWETMIILLIFIKFQFLTHFGVHQRLKSAKKTKKGQKLDFP